MHFREVEDDEEEYGEEVMMTDVDGERVKVALHKKKT